MKSFSIRGRQKHTLRQLKCAENLLDNETSFKRYKRKYKPNALQVNKYFIQKQLPQTNDNCYKLSCSILIHS